MVRYRCTIVMNDIRPILNTRTAVQKPYWRNTGFCQDSRSSMEGITIGGGASDMLAMVENMRYG